MYLHKHNHRIQFNHGTSCFTANFKCDTTRRFQCANHKCITKYQLCDGIDNCGDGSDENNMTMCASRVRPCDAITEYTCANKKCIDRSKLCDFADDCGDSSDELGCRKSKNFFNIMFVLLCYLNCKFKNVINTKYSFISLIDHNKPCLESNKGGCSHYCHNITDAGYICACYPGYIIAQDDRKHCEDIDECATGQHQCSQLCTNLNGTYSCSCRQGFELSDNRSGVCKALDTDMMILFANGPGIRAYDPHNKEEIDVIANEKRVQALDFDPKSEYVFWIDGYDNSIKRSYMVNAKGGQVKIGYAQDLNIKSNFFAYIIILRCYIKIYSTVNTHTFSVRYLLLYM